MNSSMLFNEEAIKAIGIDPSSIYPIVKPCLEISSFSSGSSSITIIEPQTWPAYFYSWVPFTKKPKEILKLLVPTQSEEELDAIDALAPAYDQLKLHPVKWEPMEWAWPRRDQKKEKDMKDEKKEQETKGEGEGWEKVWEQHLGHGRTIPPPSHGGKIKVHWMVQICMEAKLQNGEEKYVPLARVGYEREYEDKKTFEQALNSGWIQWVA
ncbi:hypothetical protein BT96DRAFT_1002310 [Gymnopus androsaceus JB14]|uniref:Uncharacterized protein n=1 Tax=Gymnopus androsaceus JB14 TaxID=1447944 RepID=A0A6A4GZ79_9AGAR|nr:hypothetical protein BT96DRAFT_1002310 [Gymnopus androsaceus JB14]